MICHLTPTSESPLSSPSKHGDRFIPSRAGANWSINFHRINVGGIFFKILVMENLNQRNAKCQVHFSLLLLQENEKSPSQNKKTKDATSDTGKGECEEDC